MRVDEEVLFTCNVCQTHDIVRIEYLLEHQCKNCNTSALDAKLDKQEFLLKEIDEAIDSLDKVIGKAMYGFMSAEEAREWIELDANNVSDTLNKAREYIQDMQEGTFSSEGS
ncbi:hypothetical protein L1N85_19650 [Paenibacillus alkaliterrae]|uniref:hypothetical protein n=1 Tax=Paenibacillus alkaliterrae TaxID=320909 RepID=UPI001F25BFBE|nr:hypothetical protein [Paenibacillus alkaliterrae]MCF2940612.1 hypothetical protein [Paenibacillus alkaliterrae]